VGIFIKRLIDGINITYTANEITIYIDIPNHAADI
jgi:hypothetical protein